MPALPASLEALIVLLVFLVPGYVAATTFHRNSPRGETSDLRFALQVAFWGTVVHAVALVPSVWSGRSESLFFLVESLRTLYIGATLRDVYATGVYLLILPALLGLLWHYVVALLEPGLAFVGLSAGSRSPTAWDRAFTPGRRGAWLYVYVRGQPEPIIGEYGIGSVAGVSPHAHDLLLKRRYDSSEIGPPTPTPLNTGVWIASDVIEYVEFFNDEEGRYGREDRHPARDRQEGRGAEHKSQAASDNTKANLPA